MDKILFFCIAILISATAQPLNTGQWISDGSTAITIQGNEVSSVSPHGTGLLEYGAMWVDGKGVNSGDHYWTIKLTDIDTTASVGLSNQQFFKEAFDCRGLFYGGNGNLANGFETLVQYFGPQVPRGESTMGILASFTQDDRLKVYFYQNGHPLGLAFDVPLSSALNDLYPVVRFFGGKGTAKIQKEEVIPNVTDRVGSLTKKIVGIEGTWKALGKTVTIDGVDIRLEKGLDQDIRDYDAILKFSSLGGDKYDASLRVINTFHFGVKKTENSWQYKHGGFRTEVGLYGKAELVENGLRILTRSPDTVKLQGQNEMTIVKGNSRATFVRFEEPPKQFVGVPF